MLEADPRPILGLNVLTSVDGPFNFGALERLSAAQLSLLPVLHEHAARTHNRSLESSWCSGTYRVSASQLVHNALSAFSRPSASPLHNYDLAQYCRQQQLCTSAAPAQPHTKSIGSCSFLQVTVSAPPRPPRSTNCRDVAASDRALRLLSMDPSSTSVSAIWHPRER
jgi:hypothetical protein